MSPDQTGGPPERRQTSDEPPARNPDLHKAEPAPPMPVEIGQESPNPLPEESKPKHRRGAARSGETERKHTE
jgi:hypothetical protein